MQGVPEAKAFDYHRLKGARGSRSRDRRRSRSSKRRGSRSKSKKDAPKASRSSSKSKDSQEKPRRSSSSRRRANARRSPLPLLKKKSRSISRKKSTSRSRSSSSDDHVGSKVHDWCNRSTSRAKSPKKLVKRSEEEERPRSGSSRPRVWRRSRSREGQLRDVLRMQKGKEEVMKRLEEVRPKGVRAEYLVLLLKVAGITL